MKIKLALIFYFIMICIDGGLALQNQFEKHYWWSWTFIVCMCFFAYRFVVLLGKYTDDIDLKKYTKEVE